MARDRIKRAVDVAAAAAGLVVIAPLAGVTAAAIVAESGRPVLFHQRRIGKDGQSFTIHKFRSMLPAGSSPGAPRRGDGPSGGDEASRVTRVGRFIRRWAIDELPQLVNVLGGEMSLVGPRPLIPEHDAQLNGSQALRRSVKPGLTGWAAVAPGGPRDWEDRVERDLYYVQHASLVLDAAVVALSLPAIVRRGEPHGDRGREPDDG